MDVTILKQYTGRNIKSACPVPVNDLSSCLAGAVTVFARCFVMVFLVYGGIATIHAAPTVPPVIKAAVVSRKSKRTGPPRQLTPMSSLRWVT